MEPFAGFGKRIIRNRLYDIRFTSRSDIRNRRADEVRCERGEKLANSLLERYGMKPYVEVDGF